MDMFYPPYPTVYCYQNSDADTWATANGYPVVYLDEPVHVWDGGTLYQPATCVHGEIYLYTCTLPDCGATQMAEVGPTDPNAHDWGDWIIDSAPTDTATGTMHRVCKNSKHHTDYFSISALNDLQALRLSDDLSVISDEAFQGAACQAVLIPEGCVSIGSRAFANCQNLVYVYLPASMKSIAADAFDGCGTVMLDSHQPAPLPTLPPIPPTPAPPASTIPPTPAPDPQS